MDKCRQETTVTKILLVHSDRISFESESVVLVPRVLGLVHYQRTRKILCLDSIVHHDGRRAMQGQYLYHHHHHHHHHQYYC